MSGTRYNITSRLLTEPGYYDLAKQEKAEQYFRDTPVVDSLAEYTPEMWNVLTDVVLWEWFGIHLPPNSVPWGKPVLLPAAMRMVYFLSYRHAPKLKLDIQERYLAVPKAADRMSIFAGYAMQVSHDHLREEEGMCFLLRQADHFQSRDDYVLIVQDLTGTL